MARRRSSRRRSSRGGGGNGIITGILIGMILAVGAVAVLMWYMNNKHNTLQQPQVERNDPNEYQRPQRPATPVTTEIIRPQDSGVPPLQVEVVPETPATPENTVASTTETDKTDKKEIAKKEESKKANDDVLGEFIRKKDQEKQVDKKPEKEKKDDLGNLIAKIDQDKQAKKNQDDDDLGNLIGRIEQKNNKQPEKQTAQKSVFKPVVEGKSVVQAGSFATQEQAENQRAKLSMLGVSTHIETAVRDGKTYYRVRSGSIDTEQAYALKKRLAEQNTDSIVIPYR